MNSLAPRGLVVALLLTQCTLACARTSLYVSGETNEFISHGQTILYEEADFDISHSYFYCSDYLSPQDGICDRLEIYLQFFVDKLDPKPSLDPDSWIINLGTDKIPANMSAGVYSNAQRTAFAEAGHPGIEIAAEDRMNSYDDGRFTIHHIAIDYSGATPKLQSLAVTFRQSSAYFDGLRRWMDGTFLYNYSGPLPSPIFSSYAVSASGARLNLENVLPGSTVTVFRAADLDGPSVVRTSFISSAMTATYTNEFASNSVPIRAFYGVDVQ